MQELSPSDIVQDEPEDFNGEHHIWPWQEVFKSTASKLSLAISEIILSVTKSALAEEMEVYEKSDHEYQMLHVPGNKEMKINIMIFIKETILFFYLY